MKLLIKKKKKGSRPFFYLDREKSKNSAASRAGKKKKKRGRPDPFAPDNCRKGKELSRIIRSFCLTVLIDREGKDGRKTFIYLLLKRGCLCLAAPVAEGRRGKEGNRRVLINSKLGEERKERRNSLSHIEQCRRVICMISPIRKRKRSQEWGGGSNPGAISHEGCRPSNLSRSSNKKGKGKGKGLAM